MIMTMSSSSYSTNIDLYTNNNKCNNYYSVQNLISDRFLIVGLSWVDEQSKLDYPYKMRLMSNREGYETEIAFDLMDHSDDSKLVSFIHEGIVRFTRQLEHNYTIKELLELFSFCELILVVDKEGNKLYEGDKIPKNLMNRVVSSVRPILNSDNLVEIELTTFERLVI